MASVNKLHIKGIRSFAPDNNSIIEFFKPLTLIVGANGAGKTTIIESLKYACTGVLPPDSKKGQAFVHDPNISGERETKAQIRLQFKTPTGKSVMVSRSFQLTNKAKKQDFKTLESSLLTVNDQGERVTQSLRCADLDSEIPALMGVSSPILQYVIFCHQEDSNWPLGDASTLKKKFDEIFAATRYTKALEIMKKQRVELQQEIKILKERLHKADSDRKKYHQIENDIKETNLKVSTIEQELNNYIVELEDLKKKKEEKERINNEMKEKIQELERLVLEYNELKKKSNEYLNMITIFLEGDINEIEDMRINFDRSLEEKKKEKANINAEVNSVKRAISEVQVKYREILDKHAQCVSSEKSKLDLINQLKTALENFKTNCDEQGLIIESYDVFYEKQHYIGLIEPCKYIVTNQERQYKTLIAQHENHIEKLSTEMESIRSKLNQLSSESNRSQYEYDQLASEIEAMKETINQKNDILNKINELKNSLENEKISLDRMIKEYDIEFLKQQMDVLSKEKENCDTKIKDLNMKIQKMRIMKEARTKYEQIQSDLQSRKEKYNSILSEYRDLFKQYMVDIETMDARDIYSVLEGPLAKINEREASLKETTDELKSKSYAIEGQISLTIENQESKKKNLKEKMKDLLEIVGDKNPIKFLESLNSEIDLLVDEIASLKSSEELYSSFKKKSTEHHSCPLCEHHIDNIDSFHQKLDQLVSNIPFLLTEKKKVLDSKKELKNKLEILLPTWREYETYQEKEEPEYERILKEYRQRREILESKIKKYEGDLIDCVVQKEEVQVLKKAVKKAIDVQIDIDDLKKALYEEEQVLLNNGNINFNEEEYRDAESNLQVQLTRKEEIDQTLSQMQKELYDKTTEIHSKEKSISSIEKEIEIANLSSTNIKYLETDLSQKENAIQEISSKINEFKQKIQEVSVELQNQIDQRENIKTQYKDEENKKKGLIEALNSQISHILILKERIEQLERVPSVDISIITHEKNEIEKKIEELNQKLETLTSKLSAIQQEIDKSDITKRNMEDNIKYLQSKKHAEILESVINEKRSWITRKYGYEFPSELQVPIKLEMNLQDFDLLVEAINNTEGQFREHIGSRRAYLEEIKSKEAMLRSFTTGTNLSVDEIYRQYLIKLKTTEAAAKDIDVYYKALDNALMKYHSNQMKNINAIIKELWQATYKGNDIETIEIRSEIDPNSSTQKKRSYNYRVIMVKGDTELDMKGRCSAGQKVLASLVIRLALAETFCLNCGILALDEPTTNLDKANVESLAQSLISIIEARRKNDNFQLIIITHDEDFVQKLGRSDYTDYYWKVTKNANQESVIVKKQIIDL